jgi:hypothetical protein
VIVSAHLAAFLLRSGEGFRACKWSCDTPQGGSPIHVFTDIQFSRIGGLRLVRSFGPYYFPDSGIPDESLFSAMRRSRLLNVLVRNLRIDVTGFGATWQATRRSQLEAAERFGIATMMPPEAWREIRSLNEKK